MSNNKTINKETIKFFNFELDALTLKKLLDFFAWFNISNLVLTIPIYAFLTPTIVLKIEPALSEYFAYGVVITILGCISYFFRYSPFMYVLMIGLLAFDFLFNINTLVNIFSKINLIEKLSSIKFEEEFCHLVLTESIFYNIINAVLPLLIYLIFFYFSYSYKKLIKCSGKISSNVICAQ